ncbi:MAG: hypothetical protein U0T11_01335 [Chitinophagaceae bacterium]
MNKLADRQYRFGDEHNMDVIKVAIISLTWDQRVEMVADKFYLKAHRKN